MSDDRLPKRVVNRKLNDTTKPGRGAKKTGWLAAFVKEDVQAFVIEGDWLGSTGAGSGRVGRGGFRPNGKRRKGEEAEASPFVTWTWM